MTVIESLIFSPISFARHTSTSPVALTPVMMFLRDVLSANGFLSDIARSRVWVSFMSRRCRDLHVSLFCSLVLYLAPLNYCIALFTSGNAGIARETLLFGHSSASGQCSTCINAGGLCIQRVARSGQVRKHLRYSFKMEISVAQPFGSDELTENPYHIEVLYLQTGRWVIRQCLHVAVADGLDPCNGFIIRHFLGVLCHGHQLVIVRLGSFQI